MLIVYCLLYSVFHVILFKHNHFNHFSVQVLEKKPFIKIIENENS